MLPVRLIRSESFRLATAFAALFLTLTGVLLLAVIWIFDHTQMAALRKANDADIATIANGYAAEGSPEAVEVVRQITERPPHAAPRPPLAYILLQEDAAGKLAGNLPGFPPREGPVQMPLTGGDQIVGRGSYIAPGVYVFVGRSTHAFRENRRLILEAFLWVALGAVVLGCGGGLIVGIQSLRRVDAVTRTCEAIIAGRFSERIPVSAAGNEWDGLASAINRMLTRIEALLEGMRQVSSDVAHDLRTPLARLRSRLEEARLKSQSVAEFDAAVASAIGDTDQLLALFSALLRLSQIEAGASTRSLTPLSLSELLERVHAVYLPVAEDQRDGFHRSIAPGVFIQGDAELLMQLFSNLVENAIRHTPAGTSIRMSLTASPPTVTIEDDGPGIPEGEREAVFRRFYQLSGARSSGGHGLGLSLVAAIADRHRASIALADAQPGLKVTVRFG